MSEPRPLIMAAEPNPETQPLAALVHRWRTQGIFLDTNDMLDEIEHAISLQCEVWDVRASERICSSDDYIRDLRCEPTPPSTPVECNADLRDLGAALLDKTYVDVENESRRLEVAARRRGYFNVARIFNDETCRLERLRAKGLDQ